MRSLQPPPTPSNDTASLPPSSAPGPSSRLRLRSPAQRGARARPRSPNRPRHLRHPLLPGSTPPLLTHPRPRPPAHHFLTRTMAQGMRQKQGRGASPVELKRRGLRMPAHRTRHRWPSGRKPSARTTPGPLSVPPLSGRGGGGGISRRDPRPTGGVRYAAPAWYRCACSTAWCGARRRRASARSRGRRQATGCCPASPSG